MNRIKEQYEAGFRTDAGLSSLLARLETFNKEVVGDGNIITHIDIFNDTNDLNCSATVSYQKWEVNYEPN